MRADTALRELARSYGVQLSYTDAWGKRRYASREALVGVLGALGAEVSRPDDAPDALAGRRRDAARRPLPPVVVAWDGLTGALEPAAGRTLQCTLTTEDGTTRSWRHEPGERFGLGSLDPGYHELVVADGNGSFQTRLISAPRRAPDPHDGSWGVFLPLFALKTARSWGIGDITDLETLCRWSGGLGAGFVATLPLFAAFLDDPFDPSPYAPVSRLFFNELYVDPARAPELEVSPEARDLIGSPGFRTEVDELRSSELIDYRRAYELKRRALSLLARDFFARASDRRQDDLKRFLARRPLAEDYADFRGGRDADAVGYHLYAQLLADEQLTALVDGAEKAGSGLQLDLPVGVHRDGYDIRRFGDSFAERANAGAPPDAFFAGGQNWGFPPLHPDGSRRDGHAYLIESVRTLAGLARVLRVDHVMGLHRMYWIPSGMDASSGVYVRYPADEIYAIFTLEAHRNGCAIVGEDLGTVPPAVRTTMHRRGLLRSHVVQFETSVEEENAISEPPRRAQSSLNTHDTPPFASFWEELEPLRKNAVMSFLRRRGLLEAGSEAGDVVRACLRFLAARESMLLLVALEDLWCERRPHNVPGTTDAERPNWRRPAARMFEDFESDDGIADSLREIDRLRSGSVNS